jgi:hypothetical protein
MSNFMDGYEDVNSRIKRFRLAHESGRIEVAIVDINIEKGYVLMQASAFREYEDLYPSAIDFAFEIRTTHGVNQNFWIECCSTSAIGRVIGLLMPSENRSTVQDLEKVERLAYIPNTSTVEDVWAVDSTITEVAFGMASGTLPPESPTCAHGHMIFKEGSSPKTGKPYHGYVCSSREKVNQCPPNWYVIGSDGKWKPQA